MRYTRAKHAAARTDDYVFAQLIPYIGNKRKLLPLLRRAIATVRPNGRFLDCFAGSGVVSRFAKSLGFIVWSNDWEPYSLPLNRCWVGRNAPPTLASLGGYAEAIASLNSVPGEEGWFTRHLCPRDDEQPDIQTERMFYTRANGLRIDAMRNQLERWRRAGDLDDDGFACLLAPMLYASCYTANTSGVFKGFHRGWGGQTQTALYRIRSRFDVRPATFHDNGAANRVTSEDATPLARRLRAAGEWFDVAYLDPPYNQHPYASNYHVLNTLTLWDSPRLPERITARGNKAAIRDDWRENRRSPYNHRDRATDALSELIAVLDAGRILVSYSTDGMIPAERLLDACCRRGRTTVATEAYKRYRVSTQRYSEKPLNVEFVAIVETATRHDGPDPSELAAMIIRQETSALTQASAADRPVGFTQSL